MAVLRTVMLLLLATEMLSWLEADDPELRLVQIALYALLGITIIANNWR